MREILDFDASTMNGIEGLSWTPKYGSSNKFAHLDRCAMDDLESLIYSMWFVVGIEFSEPYGSLLLKQKRQHKAESWVKVSTEMQFRNKINEVHFLFFFSAFQKICKRFKLGITRKAFTDICITEILSGEREPQYDRILEMLSDSIDEVSRITGQTEFEWLSGSILSPPHKPSNCSTCFV